MGKIRELDMNNPVSFESEINQELKNLTPTIDLSGMKVTLETGNEVKLWWPLVTTEEERPGTILEQLTWLITGVDGGYLTFARYPGFNCYFDIEEFICYYKEDAKNNHASRIKKMHLTHSNTRGMEMQLCF